MDVLKNPRNYVFISFTVVFLLVLAGILSFVVALTLTLLLAVFMHFVHVEQLPPQRLRKFATLFDLSYDLPENSRMPASVIDRSRVILHRGGCIDAPENTLEAVRAAARQGVAGVEIDLQFTADGVGVLLHDENLERTTSGSGTVGEKSYTEIKDLDAAAKHESRDNFEQGSVNIPTLEECLLECLKHKLLVFIDCKDPSQKTVTLLDKLFKENPELYDYAVVCSFHANVILSMRRMNPDVITALTYRKMALSTDSDCLTPRHTGLNHYLYTCMDYFNMWMTYAWAWRFCGNSFLLLNKESLCRNELNYWRSLGIHVLPWTVNSEVEKRFCMDHLNVPIITDGLGSE